MEKLLQNFDLKKSRLEVRGEVYIEKEDFNRINKERFSENEPLFANPRNAASGSLKLLDPALVSQRRLKCLIHYFGWANINLKTQKDTCEFKEYFAFHNSRFWSRQNDKLGALKGATTHITLHFSFVTIKSGQGLSFPGDVVAFPVPLVPA